MTSRRHRECLPPTTARLKVSQALGQQQSKGQAIGLRRTIALAAMLFCVIFPTLSAAAVNADRVGAILRGIAQAEAVTDPTKPGPDGELGIYRITPGTWRDRSQLPFRLCGTDRRAEESVARAHVAWIEHGYREARITPTPYRVALAWNGGLSAALNGTSPRSARDYAQRVANLVEAAQ